MRAFTFSAVLLAASATPAPTPNLLAQAMDPNPALGSYVAAATLEAELHALVPLHKTFTGTAYYQRPKQVIVFDNLPSALSRFKELASSMPTYAEASAEYAITPLSDDGKTSIYKLVPSTPGRRVKDLTLSVDDRTPTVVRAVWTYTDGGQLSVGQTYKTDGAFRLPAVERISARFPGYSVDGTLRLSHYRLNAAIPEGVFAAKQTSFAGPEPGRAVVK